MKKIEKIRQQIEERCPCGSPQGTEAGCRGIREWFCFIVTKESTVLCREALIHNVRLKNWK